MLTDLINDLDITKALVVGAYGSFAGILASSLDFEKKIDKKKYKFFKTNKEIEKESVKSLISVIGGFDAADLSNGSILSNFGEVMIYTVTFRASYSLGHYIYDKYIK